MGTDDGFLKSFRREPRPAFARALRERLREGEELARAPAWRPALAAAAALIAVGSLFAFPSVRAWGQAVLDYFRVRSFVPVSFDPARLERLQALKQDNALLVFDRQEVVQDPGRPVPRPSAEMAAAVAGFAVATPAYLPQGMTAESVSVTVTGEGRARLSVTTARLRELVAALDVRDAEIPAGLDGQVVEVHVYPVVSQRYRSERGRLDLIQSRSPEVSLPAGVDLARLGELGLRILGLEPGEARRLAAAIDWRTTLVVPVPANASAFRQVTVQGEPGLLVTTSRPSEDGKRRRRAGSVLLWTRGERLFALEGTGSSDDLMQVAESLR